MPIKVIVVKIITAIAPVTAIWLVKVNAFGTRPNKLPNKIKINRQNINGKKGFPPLPTLSVTTLLTTSNKFSANA